MSKKKIKKKQRLLRSAGCANKPEDILIRTLCTHSPQYSVLTTHNSLPSVVECATVMIAITPNTNPTRTAMPVRMSILEIPPI